MGSGRAAVAATSPVTTPTTTATASATATMTSGSGGSTSANSKGNGSATIPIPAKSSSGSNGNVIISPRYREFKTYSSTFDALQALEQSQNGATGGVVIPTAAGAVSNSGMQPTGTGNCTNLANNNGHARVDVDVEQQQQHLARNLPSGVAGNSLITGG